MSVEVLELVDRGDGTFYAPVAGYYRLPVIKPPARETRGLGVRYTDADFEEEL